MFSTINPNYVLVFLVRERLACAAIATHGDVAGVVRLAVASVVALRTSAYIGRAGCIPARPTVRAGRRRTRVELGAVDAPESRRACAQVRVAGDVATGAAIGARLNNARVEELAAVAIVTDRARAPVAGVAGKERARAGQARVVGAG